MWTDGAWTTCHGRATKVSLSLLGWGWPASGLKSSTIMIPLVEPLSINDSQIFPGGGDLKMTLGGGYKNQTQTRFQSLSPRDYSSGGLGWRPWNLFSGSQCCWPTARSRNHGFLVHNFPRSWKVYWMSFRTKFLDVS